MEKLANQIAAGTHQVLSSKNIGVQAHPDPKYLDVVRGPKHLTLAVVLVDPTQLKAIMGLEDVLATAAGVQNVLITRQKNVIYIQFALDEEFWQLVPYDGSGIGINQAGDYVTYAFDQAYPHAIVAGSTGSGKSELIRCIVAYLTDTYSPEDLRIAIIDPKGEYGDLSGLKHLIGSLAQEEDSIRSTIRAFLEEMNQRMATGKNSPRLFLIADEAQLPIVCGSKSSTPNSDNIADLSVLTRTARSANIHVLLGTQKPSHTDLPGIFDNLVYKFIGNLSDARISGSLAGAGVQADKLLGKGDFLVMTPGKIERFQAALVPEKHKYPKGILPSPLGTPIQQVSGRLLPQILAEYIIGNIDDDRAKLIGLSAEQHRQYQDFSRSLKDYL